MAYTLSRTDIASYIATKIDIQIATKIDIQIASYKDKLLIYKLILKNIHGIFRQLGQVIA